MKTKVFLICKSVIFYSQKDEDMFFTWIKKIKCIEKFEGAGDELYLDLKSKVISDQNLRDLLALFYRYKIDMKQLKIFLNKRNEKWFYGNPKGYWHKKVFAQKKDF
jgi:hypothetical protein